MHNELLHFGPFTVYGYGTMICLGVLTGWVVINHRAKKMNLDPDFLISFILVAVGLGFFGAKLLFWIVNLPLIIEDISFFFDSLLDGFVVIGGIVLGITSAVIFCLRHGEDPLFWLDLILPEVALGQGFGRLGCFLAGCCYGKETSSPLGIVFHESLFAPNGVRLIPTQLISSGLNFCNAAICLALAPHLKRGKVSALYLFNYSVGRFILEFFRGDKERGFLGPLSTSQWVSLGLFAVAVLIFVLGDKRREAEPERKTEFQEETKEGLK